MIPRDVHLDPVDADFDLAPDLGHDLLARAHHHTVATRTGVRQQAPRRATHTRHHHVATRTHARPCHHVRLDGIAQVHAEIENAVGIEKARDARLQHLVGVVGGDDGGEAGPAVEEQFVVAVGFVEGDVAVGIDHAGHHVLAARIDADQAWICRDGGVHLAHREDAALVKQYGALEGRVAEPVDQGAVFDQGTPCGHVELLPLLRVVQPAA